MTIVCSSDARSARILEYLKADAVAAPFADRPADLTVGLELEAFLLDTQGRPVDQSASQNLFHRLAKQPGWIPDPFESLPEGDMLPSVRRAERSGGETVIKYDHAPHLIEIATGPFDGLVELAAALSAAEADLQRCTDEVGIILSLRSHLKGPLPESPLPLFQRLRRTRQIARDSAGLPRRRRAENYAAGIAAVQLHVGGLHWGKRPEWMGRLHAFEPALLSQLSGSPVVRSTGLQRRWRAYQDAFPGNPLIGFPDLWDWSLENWAEALANAPLLVHDGPVEDVIDWEDFRFRVRDLQIIRPRSFGTVEFRADPLQPTLAKNLRMAALRLGLSASLFEDRPPIMPFRSARAAWWSAALGEVPLGRDMDIVVLAEAGLASRGKGEEGLLYGA